MGHRHGGTGQETQERQGGREAVKQPIGREERENSGVGVEGATSESRVESGGVAVAGEPTVTFGVPFLGDPVGQPAILTEPLDGRRRRRSPDLLAGRLHQPGTLLRGTYSYLYTRKWWDSRTRSIHKGSPAKRSSAFRNTPSQPTTQKTLSTRISAASARWTSPRNSPSGSWAAIIFTTRSVCGSGWRGRRTVRTATQRSL